jgi:hypothetical protein
VVIVVCWWLCLASENVPTFGKISVENPENLKTVSGSSHPER